MARTRYRLAFAAVLALATVGVVYFNNGSQATTGGRQALTAATVPAADAPAGAPAPAAPPAPATPAPAPSPDRPPATAPDRTAAGDLSEGPVEDASPASAPDLVLRATLSPGEGEVVGIGQPAVVTFDKPIAAPDRPAVEERLAVATNPPVEGAWRWITPGRVHWRPAVYWPPGTEITVRSDLRGLQVGAVSGADERTVHFRIGAAHVSTIDAATHQMTVTDGGQAVRVIPASLGQRRYPTANGVHVTLEKSRQVTMDSSTVGIPRNGPGGYYRKVAWATRISYSGTFIHAAPWSMWAQGKQNVSHGCINVSTTDAKWFYDFTQRGDIVEVVNSTAKPKLYDPGTADWTIPWDQWKAGDTAA